MVPTSILALLENSSQSVRVDAISAQVLAESLARPADLPLAAHQFEIVRTPGESRIADPTFAQFLEAGSPDVKQGPEVLARGFLDTPQGAAFARELVGSGSVSLTLENAALYARALGLDPGPPGSTNPGPVARLLFSGDQHFGIVSLEAQAGSIRFVEIDPKVPGAPITREQEDIRRSMVENIEGPFFLIPKIEETLRAPRSLATPDQLAAIERLEKLLDTLKRLQARHGQTVGPWAPLVPVGP